MQIRRIFVENFKAIKGSGWIELEPNPTTIIGRNEAGKTSILNAISYLGNDDRVPDSKLNERGVAEFDGSGELVPVVTAELLIEAGDKTERKLPRGSGIETTYLTKFADGSREVFYKRAETSSPPEIFEAGVARNLLRKKLHSAGVEIPNNPAARNDTEAKEALMDFVLLESEYVRDTVGIFREIDSSISDVDYPELEEIGQVLQELLSDAEEASICSADVRDDFPPVIFEETTRKISDSISRSEIEDGGVGKPVLYNLVNSIDVNWTDSATGEIERKLNNLSRDLEYAINDAWSQKSVRIDIVPNFSEDDLTEIEIRVSDFQTHDGERARSPRDHPSDRSDGFHRFLTLYLDVISRKPENGSALVLLDDPGVYFHPIQKGEMLETISSDFAESSTVIYTTHSPFMINLQNPAGTRVIDQGSGTIKNRIMDAEEGSIRPVSEALGLSVGLDLFGASGRILAEGPTEYYLIPAISEYFRENDLEGLSLDGYRVLQMAGVGNSEKFSKWAVEEDIPFVILLDNDEPGEEMKDELVRDNPELEDCIQMLDEREEDDDRNVEFEDMFPPDEYLHAVNDRYSSFDEFTTIRVEDESEGWYIEDELYEGENLANIAKKLVENQIEHDFSKLKVAQTLGHRIRDGQVSTDSLDRFVQLFQTIKYEH
ncbi:MULTISPECIES: ATP-dependent endonuclease [Haloferax]|uniref:ATP-dependent nuclease n=1 Tax=Haloferax TaxID=2251 RepID=UPI0012AF561F|nr:MULTISPECIES: AAA family ATPase [Haloferax]